MLRNKIITLVFTHCLLLFLANQALSQTSSLTGEQIVQKMAAQYASAKSYQDVGIVQSGSAKSERAVEEINSFKTYFVRPKQLRFEWEDKSSVLPKRWHIVWSDGKDTFTYWESDAVEKDESLSMGIAGATGVSQGSAHTVPALLLEEVGGFRLSEMERISLLREERFEGEDCFVVRGFHPFNFPIDLWISRKDFLLRKAREQNKDGTFDEEIRRNVKLNEPIPAEKFKYTPPQKKDSRVATCLPSIALPLGLALLFSAKERK